MTITKDQLIKEISTPMGKARVLKLTGILKEQQFAIRDLIDLTFHPDKTIAFRAAWLLENLFLQNQAGYLNELDYLLQRIPEVKHPGCQRHYAKIMMHLTRRKVLPAIKDKLANTDLDPIVEQCFNWVIDPKVLIAVKVFALEALCNLSTRYDWVKEELKEHLQFMMRDGSAAIQIRGRQLLASLK
jgi:hypothetical protein